MALALWNVLETGAAGPRQQDARTKDDVAWEPHQEALLSLLRAKLMGEPGDGHGVWLDRRELLDVLMVLDDGLQILARQAELQGCQHEAVAEFLGEVRRHLPVPKKPVLRQPEQAQRERAAAAAAGA